MGERQREDSELKPGTIHEKKNGLIKSNLLCVSSLKHIS